MTKQYNAPPRSAHPVCRQVGCRKPPAETPACEGDQDFCEYHAELHRRRREPHIPVNDGRSAARKRRQRSRAKGTA